MPTNDPSKSTTVRTRCPVLGFAGSPFGFTRPATGRVLPLALTRKVFKAGQSWQ